MSDYTQGRDAHLCPEIFPLPVVDKGDQPINLEFEVMPGYVELDPSKYCRRDLGKSCVYADGYTAGAGR
jgi:hypothetical protein